MTDAQAVERRNGRGWETQSGRSSIRQYTRLGWFLTVFGFCRIRACSKDTGLVTEPRVHSESGRPRE